MAFEPIELTTVDAVIKALGGDEAVQAMAGLTTSMGVWQYRARGTFPAKLYVVMTEALAALGYTAPSFLWNMVESPREDAARQESSRVA